MKRRATPLTWLLLISAALLPIVLLSVYAFGVASDATRTLALSELQSRARFAHSMAESQLSATFSALRAHTASAELSQASLPPDYPETSAKLEQIRSKVPELDLLIYLDSNGTVLTTFPRLPNFRGRDASKEIWHISATNGQAYSTIHDEAARSTLFSAITNVGMSVPIFSDTDQHIGTLIARHPVQNIAGIQQFGNSQSDGLCLAMPNGTPVGIDARQLDRIPNLKNLLLQPLIQAHEFTSGNDEERFIGAAVSLAGMRIVAWQSRQLAYAPVRKLAARIGLASGILSLAAVALIVVLEGSRKNNDRLNLQLQKHIDELRRSEERLDRERFLLGTLMETIPDHIYFKDRESCFIRINPAMAKVFKLDNPDDAIGKSDTDFFTEEHAKSALADEREILRSGDPMINREEKETWPDGSVTWVSTTKDCLRDREQNIIGTFGISRDITKRKRAEEALALKAEELARSNSELEQFAYAASHDLQEPLRMIASYTQLLSRRYKDKLDDDAQEFIGYAVDGATRMQVLINDLLAYSRVGTRGKPFEDINLQELLGQVTANLRIAIEESDTTLNSENLPTIRGDATQLNQLFQNLISNGIKFRGDRKPVIDVIASDSSSAEGGSDDPATEEWLFAVKDNGIGIAPEFFERIFVIFQRLHNRTEYAGTGIGLAVCKKIVERHGGRIWVESSQGTGTTFHFAIPKKPKDPTG